MTRFLTRLFRRFRRPTEAHLAPERRSTITHIVGVTFDGRQDVLRRWCRDTSEIELVREPDNPHDQYAIGVWLKKPRRHIGYLNRRLARRLHDTQPTAKIERVVGGGELYTGVRIKVTY